MVARSWISQNRFDSSVKHVVLVRGDTQGMKAMTDINQNSLLLRIISRFHGRGCMLCYVIFSGVLQLSNLFLNVWCNNFLHKFRWRFKGVREIFWQFSRTHFCTESGSDYDLWSPYLHKIEKGEGRVYTM